MAKKKKSPSFPDIMYLCNSCDTVKCIDNFTIIGTYQDSGKFKMNMKKHTVYVRRHICKECENAQDSGTAD